MATVLTPERIKELIQEWIVPNGKEEIRADMFNTILSAIMSYVGVGYACKGVAPQYAPSSEVPVLYIGGPGTYKAYYNEDVVVPQGSIIIWTNDLEGAWSHTILDVATSIVAAEIQRATGKEGQLQQQISSNAEGLAAEILRATGKEGQLQQQITSNAEGLAAEILRATGKEGQLQQQITSNAEGLAAEVQRATGKEGQMQEQINTNTEGLAAEVQRAQAAESRLQDIYEGLTQNPVIVGPLPASGQADTIYRVPGTSSYADYMWDGTQFVLMATYTAGHVALINVNVLNHDQGTPHAAYASAAAARADITAASGLRALGLQITYLLTDGVWYTDQYIGTDISGWSTASNWKTLGPVRVTHNTQTGKTELKIGGDVALIVDKEPTSNSTNLVESGGVKAALDEIDKKNALCSGAFSFSDLTQGGYYNSSNGEFVSNNNMAYGYFEIPSLSKILYVRSARNGYSYESVCFFDVDDEFIESYSLTQKFKRIEIKSNYAKVAFSLVNADATFSAVFLAVEVDDINESQLSQLLQRKVNGLINNRLFDDTIPDSLSNLLKIIKNIRVINSQPSIRYCIYNIRKNYNGHWMVFIAYQDSATYGVGYACTYDSEQEESLITMDMELGGKIEIAIDWSQMSVSEIAIGDRTKAVISIGCYETTFIDDYQERTLRTALWAMDAKNPFKWATFDKCYLSLMNDDGLASMPNYMLACQQYGVPYCHAFPYEKIGQSYTYTDPDGNKKMLLKGTIIGSKSVTYQDADLSSMKKVMLYVDKRSAKVGASWSIKLTPTGGSTTTIGFTVKAGKNYFDIPSLGSATKLKVQMGGNESFVADMCNLYITPYQESANNTTKSAKELLTEIVDMFGEILLHGLTVIDDTTKAGAESKFYQYCYVGKHILEDAIGADTINGFITVGGTNSNRWFNTELGQKYMLRCFLYGDYYGTTPQYQVQRTSTKRYTNIISFEVPTGSLNIYTNYKINDIWIQTTQITNNGSTDIVYAWSNSVIEMPISGNVTDYTDSSIVVCQFTNGINVSDGTTIGEQYAIAVKKRVIDNAISNGGHIVIYSHEDVPPYCYAALIEELQDNNGVVFSTWKNVYDEFKSSDSLS